MIGRRMVTVALALALVQSVGAGPAMSNPAGPTQFRPQEATTDDYAVGPRETVWVKAPDGADMYVEVYRPVTGAKLIPVPARLPVILAMTPYQGEGTRDTIVTKYLDTWRERFVPNGYAFAVSHGYGTGNSEGCLDFYGTAEVAATSAVIEHLGAAPWSNGRVGMLGGSYDGGYAVHAAALGSEAAKAHLAAISVDAPAVSLYDYDAHDGVPFPGAATNIRTSYAAAGQPPAKEAPTGPAPDPVGTASRQASACRAETYQSGAEVEATGDFSSWYLERTARRRVGEVRAATLFFQGFHDDRWAAMPPVGFFDRLPKTTPRKLVLGQWGHAMGNSYRKDYWIMIQAWFDRFLLDLPVDTASWPQVQVQDTAGGWRAEKDWPATGGPIGQLALTESGSLGAQSPTGSSIYVEGSAANSSSDAPTRAVFSTGELKEPLHLAGQPVMDLWVELDQPDAHVSVLLNAFAADGTRITSDGLGVDQRARFPIVGFRSARHLDPIVGEFRQAAGRPAPTGTPVRIPVRFYSPLDLVVPKGGSITIEIAGTSMPTIPSSPSGAAGEVKILHSCAYPSTLRFEMPKAEPEWLDVTMTTRAQNQLHGVESGPSLRDGDGLATARVCDRKPVDPAEVLERG